MLDKLRLSIPFFAEHVTGANAYLTAQNAIKNGHKGMVNIRDLGFEKLASRAVSFEYDEDGIRTEHADHLYHPFESLPSSFTDLAFKVYDDSNCYPCVELKCSPAKILQGHNVFGSTDIKLGATDMLMILQKTYPLLSKMLDIEACEVMELDTTYSARLESESIALQVMQFLSKYRMDKLKPVAVITMDFKRIIGVLRTHV